MAVPAFQLPTWLPIVFHRLPECLRNCLPHWSLAHIPGHENLGYNRIYRFSAICKKKYPWEALQEGICTQYSTGSCWWVTYCATAFRLPHTGPIRKWYKNTSETFPRGAVNVSVTGVLCIEQQLVKKTYIIFWCCWHWLHQLLYITFEKPRYYAK